MVEPNAPLTNYNVVTELDDVASTEVNVLIPTCDFGISFLSITKTSHVKKRHDSSAPMAHSQQSIARLYLLFGLYCGHLTRMEWESM